LEDSLKDLSAKLDVYDGILGQQKYMAGNEFSLIDVFFIPYIYKMFKLEIGNMVMDRPHLKTWWESVSSRPSVKKWAAW
jgi:glutathione S-transferase